jgi:hypothetical protein
MKLATQAAQADRAGRARGGSAALSRHAAVAARRFDALHMLGVLLSQQGQQAAALPLFDRAL